MYHQSRFIGTNCPVLMLLIPGIVVRFVAGEQAVFVFIRRMLS